MIPTFALYSNVHFLPTPDLHPSLSGPRSSRSGKTSSRKGSTDIDSRTKFKTEVCRYWINAMECPFGNNCNFAHGDEEVRVKQSLPSKYKTRGCHKFKQEGYCPYGVRCQFIHRLQKPPRIHPSEMMKCLASETEKFFTFLQQKEKISGKSQRLAIFQSLGGDNDTSGYKISVLEVRRQGQAQNHVDIRARHNSF